MLIISKINWNSATGHLLSILFGMFLKECQLFFQKSQA